MWYLTHMQHMATDADALVRDNRRWLMEITANAAQEVTRGNNVIFTDTVVPGNCSIIHREGSGLVKLRGLTNGQCRARFKVFFGGNIAIPEDGTTDPISLVLAIDGEPIQTTKMIVTPQDVNTYFNVASSIYLDVPKGCCSTIGVKNSDGPALSVQNANLIIERVA